MRTQGWKSERGCNHDLLSEKILVERKDYMRCGFPGILDEKAQRIEADGPL